MHDTFLVLIGVLVGLFVIANGLLLTLWPQRFLRFYDFWNRGDYVGRTASWRGNVEKVEFKLLGLAAMVVGAAMVWDLVRVGGWLR
jgi:uncharacterized protein YjeT (DUF2065 family)